MEKQQILIEDNQKVVELTFDQLKQTRTFADAHGIMPRQFPIEHHVFIQKLLDMGNSVGAEPVVAQILCSVKNIERISKTEAESKGLDQNDAENTSIKVLIGRIDLGNKFARKLWNLSIGFMYHEKGIEVAIGTNIAICSNMTIFGDTTHYRNHGRNGIEMSEMFKEIENWFGNLESFEFANSELLERMEAIPIDWEHDCNLFLGDCLRRTVAKNYHKGDPFAMTTGQVSKMASYIIGKENDELHQEPTLYHMYNAATFILTHNDDLTNRFADIKAFTEWFKIWYLEPYEKETPISDARNLDDVEIPREAIFDIEKETQDYVEQLIKESEDIIQEEEKDIPEE